MTGLHRLLVWSVIFHCSSCQYFDSNSEINLKRAHQSSPPYDVFTNQSHAVERSIYEDNYRKDYDASFDNGKYYTNATYRERGNVTEYYDPKVYGPTDQFPAKAVEDSRRLQNYASSGGNWRDGNSNYYNNNNAYDVNSYPSEKSRGDYVSRTYEDNFRDKTYEEREREAVRKQQEEYARNPQQSSTGSSYQPKGSGGSSSYFDRNVYGETNSQLRNYEEDAAARSRNSNYQQEDTRNRNSDGDARNRNSDGDARNRNYDGDSRNRNYNQPIPGPGSNRNYWANPGDPGYPRSSGNTGGRGVFDPGYPYKNVWNEHWSTTTDRPIAPGVLGKWRSDLQGQQRPEDVHHVPTPVYVTTNYGRVQGFKVKLYDGPWVPLHARPGVTQVEKVQKTISAFTGIPYARPPINEGRFRPPRPHTGWQLHQAVDFGPACPQPSRFFGYSAGITQVDEDCLFLNVFSPDVGAGAKGSPYPVIFYIHDGDFTHGASNQFPPHQLVGWYDLVVVTVNFRLGAIGFLSTADEFSPGNYGMLDLSLALKWVYDNIRTFNGDPDRINVVGLGSGAAAAGLLMLAPRSRRFVKNVVAMEGSPTADWAAIIDKYRVQNTTELFSLKLGCWQDHDRSTWKTIDCLRKRSWQELANLELDGFRIEPDVGTFPWSPAVDREFRVPKDDFRNDWKEEDWRFLPDDPEKLLRHGEYPYVKYVTGFARQSAADLLYANKTLAPNYVVTREWFDEMIHLWVKKYNYTLNPEGVFSAIRYAYTYWPDPSNVTHLREQYIEFLSDALYRSPIDQTVKLLLARGIQVHQYLLNYTLEGLRLPFWREVPRGMEYYLLSGAPFMDPEFFPERLRVDRSAWTEGDRNMSNFFMSAIANLAHFGQPTHHEILGIFWEKATPADLKYLSLNSTNNSTMHRNYRQRELTFWSEYMPSLVGRYVPTYPPTTEYWWEPNEPLQIAFWTVSGICLILVVVIVACFLLWRTAKKQRDRIYDDLNLSGGPIGLGTIVGDEISEYAETVKTADSMDSGVKLTAHHHNPNPHSQNSTNVMLHQMYPSPPQTHPRERDRFPTPKRNVRDRDRDTPQTQV